MIIIILKSLSLSIFFNIINITIMTLIVSLQLLPASNPIHPQSPVNSRSFRNSRGSFSTESSLAQVFTEQYIYKGEDVAGKTIVVPMARYQQTGGTNAKRTVPAKGAKQGGSGDLKQMGVTATAGTGASYGRPGLVITVTLTKEVNHVSVKVLARGGKAGGEDYKVRNGF